MKNQYEFLSVSLVLVLIPKLWTSLSHLRVNADLQGISIRPLIKFINVRRTNRNLDTINVEIHCRVSHKHVLKQKKKSFFCFCVVLMFLTLLSAHGAHQSWHRGPLWPVEPPLLEGQVRQSFSEPGPSFCVLCFVWQFYCSLCVWEA